MSTARAVPFRAGTLPGTVARDFLVLAELFQSHDAGTKTLLCDISEFQPGVTDAACLAWSKAIIIRAAYGASHDDGAWYGGQRRDLLLSGGALFLGIYQYITAGEDITAQAQAYCRLLGKLNKGEYPLADWEEGAGNQSGRRATWNHVVASELGFTPGTGYSGLFFARDHGLAPVEWVAAYQPSPPPAPWLLWQFTDAFDVPGVGAADCSVYDGPVTGLAAHAYGGTPAKPPPFPYPASDYLGLAAADPHCHSGYYPADRPHVLTWQQQMAHRGWAVPVTGRFSAACDTACRAFQGEFALAVDGRVGPVTWRAAFTLPVT